MNSRQATRWLIERDIMEGATVAPPSYKAPQALGRAIKKAKTQATLKPLLQAYHAIYGFIPDNLCELYVSLSKE